MTLASGYYRAKDSAKIVWWMLNDIIRIIKQTIFCTYTVYLMQIFIYVCYIGFTALILDAMVKDHNWFTYNAGTGIFRKYTIVAEALATQGASFSAAVVIFTSLSWGTCDIKVARNDGNGNMFYFLKTVQHFRSYLTH